MLTAKPVEEGQQKSSMNLLTPFDDTIEDIFI